jgi:hypothetical protein
LATPQEEAMRLLEAIEVTDSIKIRTTPEKIFGFFLQIVDDASYRAWHPEDHVAFRWINGEPWQEGSVAYAEEYIHGKLHKFKFLIKRIVANREIELVPLSRFLRIYFPRNTLSIEPRGDSCLFTASGVLRVGRVAKLLAKRKLEQGLSSVRKHMKEEGENLKRILEEGRCTTTPSG